MESIKDTDPMIDNMNYECPDCGGKTTPYSLDARNWRKGEYMWARIRIGRKCEKGCGHPVWRVASSIHIDNMSAIDKEYFLRMEDSDA